LHNYHAILARYGLEWSDTALRSADVQHLDEQAILALIMGVIRAERFCEGVLLAYFKDGYIIKWLKRLAEIDR
jgi:ADP-ribosyl-[dinitrogen reductase] hydrolase